MRVFHIVTNKTSDSSGNVMLGKIKEGPANWWRWEACGASGKPSHDLAKVLRSAKRACGNVRFEEAL